VLLRLCLAAVLLALGGWGCGTDETERDPEPGAPLPPTVQAHRQVFGYIRAVDASTKPATLEFDEAEWLSGEAAQEAAEADGAIEPGQPVPNDYYARNHDKSTRTLEIAPEATVTAERCQLCRSGRPGNLEDFLAAFSSTDERTYDDDYRGAASQYWLTIEDDRVLAIDEQYRP
jgi:hypothetical protein